MAPFAVRKIIRSQFEGASTPVEFVRLSKEASICALELSHVRSQLPNLYLLSAAELYADRPASGVRLTGL